MIYHQGYCFSAYEMFETFDTSKLKIPQKITGPKYGANKRQYLCVYVFLYCCYLILLDIIKNNVTFALPLFNGKQAYMYVRPITGDAFKTARQLGGFAGIDFLATNFTGYMLTLSWKTRVGIKYKPIYINKQFKDMIYKNAIAGQSYF